MSGSINIVRLMTHSPENDVINQLHNVPVSGTCVMQIWYQSRLNTIGGPGPAGLTGPPLETPLSPRAPSPVWNVLGLCEKLTIYSIFNSTIGICTAL